MKWWSVGVVKDNNSNEPEAVQLVQLPLIPKLLLHRCSRRKRDIITGAIEVHDHAGQQRAALVKFAQVEV
jgi:hypothetical protein